MKKFKPPSIEKAWSESLKSEFGIHFKDCPDELQFLEAFIEDLFSSELLAVLGEEKSELAKKPFGEDKEYDKIALAEITLNIGWNTHLQDCLKRAKLRGIIN